MPNAMLTVYSSPSDPSREDEYNQWYDTVHAIDVLKIPGIVSCTRYKLSDTQMGEPGVPANYMAVYEIELAALADVPKNFLEKHLAGELPVSDVIAVGPMVFWDPASDRIS